MFSKILLVVVVVATVVVVVVATASPAAADRCAPAQDCAQCLALDAHCGWCSVNVSTANGALGPHCVSTASKFICHGVYSTDQCKRAYVCDNVTMQCQLGKPGAQGQTKQQCESSCINDFVYTCDNATHTCKKAPAGTPGASSLEVCEEHCSPTATATGSPHSHHPHPTSTSVGLFACNYSSGECMPSQPGKGASKEVCEQTCKKAAVTYFCNAAIKKCEAFPPDHPDGTSLPVCEEKCNPTPAPHPPSNFPLGLYRGLFIDHSQTHGVVYVDVKETSFTMVMMKDNKVESYLEGVPSHIPPSATNEHPDIMSVKITAPAEHAGKTLNSITDLGSLPGPETDYITMAYAAQLDEPAPQHVASAMTDSSQRVLALAKCQTPECVFHLPPLPKSIQGVPPLQSALKSKSNSKAAAAVPYVDPCATFSTCTECLNGGKAHTNGAVCGWCGSGGVTFLIDGKQVPSNVRCAGYGPSSTTTEYTCSANFQTLTCTVGYECMKNATPPVCAKAPLGSGEPKNICEKTCTAHTPAPAIKQYVCNTSTYKCEACTTASGACAGGMPDSQCTESCSKHKHKKGPGPVVHPGDVLRGFYINEDYKDVEVDWVFGNTTVTEYVAGKQTFEATVDAFAATAWIFTFTSPAHLKGFSRSYYYQDSPGRPSFYESLTVAASTVGGPMPEAFPPAMTTPGEAEYVFYKCVGSPCKFSKP